MKSLVEGTKEGGFLPSTAPDAALLAALAHDIAPLRPSRPQAYVELAANPGVSFARLQTSVGTPSALLLELAGIKAAIRTWHDKQPDEVLREASAYSARLTEVWTELRLLEVHERTFLQLRTMQVTPVLEEIDRQMKFALARISMLRQDLDMAIKGGGA